LRNAIRVVIVLQVDRAAALLEEAMKKSILILAIMSAAMFVCLHANAKNSSNDKTGYQSATVISVDKHVAESTNVGGSPTDAPLQADDYSYNIGIRLNCDLYVGRYKSATDYLPSVFVTNHAVDVRLQKHIMYVSLPDSDREVKMGIVSHGRVKNEPCQANG
jgi:hypothetical protein